jgi:hypothetical protein
VVDAGSGGLQLRDVHLRQPTSFARTLLPYLLNPLRPKGVSGNRGWIVPLSRRAGPCSRASSATRFSLPLSDAHARTQQAAGYASAGHVWIRMAAVGGIHPRGARRDPWHQPSFMLTSAPRALARFWAIPHRATCSGLGSMIVEDQAPPCPSRCQPRRAMVSCPRRPLESDGLVVGWWLCEGAIYLSSHLTFFFSSLAASGPTGAKLS